MQPTFDDIRAFAAIAQHRSFRRAASELNVTPSALSHKMRAIEEGLGVRLLNRTTRSVTLTEAGVHLLKHFQPVQEQLGRLLESVSVFRVSPVGTLKLNVPAPALQIVVAPLLPKFLAANPLVTVEVVTDNSFVDIVDQGFDAGIRFLDAVPRDMIAVPIGPAIRFSVVGAPSYFENHSRPLTPADLADAVCIGRRFPNGRSYAWEFSEGRSQNVVGPLLVDDDAAMMTAALSGIGLAYLYGHHVEAHVDAGRLIEVLPEYRTEPEPFHLYFPTGRQMPYALRAFVDYVRSAQEGINSPAGGNLPMRVPG